MRALTANLATRPFRNNTLIGSIVAAAAAGLLLATIYNLYIFLSYGSSYAALLDDQERNRTKLEALEVEERSLVKQIEARDFTTAFDQGSVANELILKRTFSWTELFNKLEDLMPQDVMMSAIRPNVTANDIVIRVEGVAKTHLAFLTLQENLLAHESFSEVYPVSIRRLNPNRPEINFILNFNYRQSERLPADTVVAENAAPPAAAGGETTDERAALHDEVLRAAAAANVLPVGRDGRPRTLEVIARRMVAPGGVYEPPALRPPAATKDEAQRGSNRQGGVATSETGQGTAPTSIPTLDAAASETATQDAAMISAALAATAASGQTGGASDDFTPPASTPTDIPAEGTAVGPAGAGTNTAPAAPTGGQGSTPGSLTPGAAAGAGASRTVESATTTDRSRRRQRLRPAAGATGPSGTAPAATPPQMAPGPAGTAAANADDPSALAVTQPDLDLNFNNRPVRELYRILGTAHGVRFVVDAAISFNETLSVNLNGLSLEEVIARMAEIANQRILLLRPGIYHVVAISEGESLLEPPVEEESLPATEGTP